MSKITLSFMQRFMGNLDTAIKNYLQAKYAPLEAILPKLEDGTTGTYILKAVNNNGTTTYEWVKMSTVGAYLDGTTIVLPTETPFN